MKDRFISLMAVGGLLLMSCGGDDSSGDDTAAPDVTEPETTEPLTTKPEITEPEITEPLTTEPEITEPETSEPETTDAPLPAEPELTIEVLEAEDPGGFGSFTASGVAVDESIVCDAGEGMIVGFLDADTEEPPPWAADPENLLVDWQFTCDDGSGEFTLRLNQPAHTDADTAAFLESGGTGKVWDEGSRWHTLTGTDAYADLVGEGTLTFEVLDPSGRPSRATWVGAVSSGSEVTFTMTDDPGEGTGEAVAAGDAVANGLVCTAATITSSRFENLDGSELSEAELAQRNDGTASHSFVAIAEYECVDESGSFTFRGYFEIEGPAAFEMTLVGWEYEGGGGYDGVTGGGQRGESTITTDPRLVWCSTQQLTQWPPGRHVSDDPGPHSIEPRQPTRYRPLSGAR